MKRTFDVTGMTELPRVDIIYAVAGDDAKLAEAAVKAAAMTEEVAHTMWAAKQLGDIIPISQEDIDSLNDRYTNVYGQH